MYILNINGHDYSRYIASGGYKWTREDLDSEKTTRTKDGKLRRDKICAKRKLSFEMMPMPRSMLIQLNNDLSQPTFQARYLDLYGEQKRTFYCSSFPSDLVMIINGGVELWQGASFNMIEV